jgi:1-phosphofructokinase family hexose kinase
VIITVTLNPAIDKTLEVPNFQLGRRHRSVEQRSLAGGKGLNVARALRRLGHPVLATGLAGGPTGTRIVEQLTEESILNGFVRIREESRTNTAVMDPTIRSEGNGTGRTTEINEPGPEVSEQEIEMLRDKLLYLAQGAEICVFAGSLPRGVDPGLYAHLVRDVGRLGVTTVLDADGEALRQGVRAEPAIISPNTLEAEGLVGHEFNDDQDHVVAVREMVALGAREAIMTTPDGCFGQVIEDGGPQVYRVRVEPLEPRASVGSGDAFLAGYVAARCEGRPPVECLRFGVACGAESTQHLGAGLVDPRAVERLLDEVSAQAAPQGAEVG